MNIADLNHLETISEDNQVIGGAWKNYVFPKSKADAYADAVAVGSVFNWTKTATYTEAVAGLYSRSASASSSVAIG